MATNGAAGFRKNGIEKLDYQHGDGWLSDGLGENVIHFIQLVDTSKMVECFDDIEVSENAGIDFDETLDLSFFVTGRKKYMVDGKKYHTDYDYILDLDKEVLDYSNHNYKFEIGFDFIRSNKIQEVVDFIKAKSMEIQFDEQVDKFEKEMSECLKNGKIGFYLGPDQWGSNLELESYDESLDDYFMEDVECGFIYHDSFESVESFKKKIEDFIERLKTSSGIDIAVTQYYSTPW